MFRAVALAASIGVNVPASTYCALPTARGADGSHVELRELVGGALQQSRVERSSTRCVCCPVLPSIAGSTAMTPRGARRSSDPSDPDRRRIECRQPPHLGQQVVDRVVDAGVEREIGRWRRRTLGGGAGGGAAQAASTSAAIRRTASRASVISHRQFIDMSSQAPSFRLASAVRQRGLFQNVTATRAAREPPTASPQRVRRAVSAAFRCVSAPALVGLGRADGIARDWRRRLAIESGAVRVTGAGSNRRGGRRRAPSRAWRRDVERCDRRRCWRVRRPTRGWVR